MAINIWGPRRLYKLLKDERFDRTPSHFLDTYFTEVHYSAESEILLRELPHADRKMAPFVVPTAQGKPIFGAKGESVRALTPAYLKPKDVVRPTEARSPRISEIFDGPMSLAERFDLRVAEVTQYHLEKIRLREAWMAARAFIDGSVTIRYDAEQGFPHSEVTVSFGRDAGHTVDSSGTPWTTSSDILGFIQTQANKMQAAVRGGYPSRIYLGQNVVEPFRKNAGVIAEMNTQRRGTTVDVPTGVIKHAGIADPVVYLGTLGPIEIYSYRDRVQAPDDSWVEILDPDDILMVAPGATGVRAYGAIYDVDAIEDGRAISTDIFPKMFKTQDPGELYVMHQSAPLPIPLYPNRTLKATVLP